VVLDRLVDHSSIIAKRPSLFRRKGKLAGREKVRAEERSCHHNATAPVGTSGRAVHETLTFDRIDLACVNASVPSNFELAVAMNPHPCMYQLHF
jgi:hypothetical protein